MSRSEKSVLERILLILFHYPLLLFTIVRLVYYIFVRVILLILKYWIISVIYAHSAIQTCITLLKVGRPAPHHEARQKRRELRQKQQADQEELELRMRELQMANENKQRELEAMRKVCNVLQQLLSFQFLATHKQMSLRPFTGNCLFSSFYILNVIYIWFCYFVIKKTILAKCHHLWKIWLRLLEKPVFSHAWNGKNILLLKWKDMVL